jgi:adenylate cyclase class IV
MSVEYEYEFLNYDKKYIISEIKKKGAKKLGQFIFKVIVFTHPLSEKSATYIRIRDEGHKITMTTKTKSDKSQFENENEVIINDFDEAVNILYSLGCIKKYYYEKIREIWRLKDAEIVFDINPCVPERMEIEAKSKKILDSLVNDLNLQNQMTKEKNDRFSELYGVQILKNVDLTFNTAKKTLSKSIKKNKDLFNKIIAEQKELYNSLLKKI